MSDAPIELLTEEIENKYLNEPTDPDEIQEQFRITGKKEGAMNNLAQKLL